ncbi:AI-2E family transporter [Pontivivens nitratireducens]|uniref:AI-2E family transporter n=1 Tax=Pontivivens nitratireducens TaxID=2758038 RepID=A0A6G7VNL7_9RHOB|nr:AI-2E family transporter [Pontibrevibacter nitratireducens]QIK41387.1 AI-2E family transporter [Pontibrevibacter nitratireducens]
MTQLDRGIEGRVIAWAVTIIAIIMLTGAMASARDFLMPVLAAILLALVFRPVRRGMNRIGFSDGIAALVITLTLVSGLAALVTALAQPASEWIDDAPNIAYRIERKLASLQGTVEAVNEAAQKIDELAETGGASASTEVASQDPDGMQSVQVEVSDRDGNIAAQIAATAPLVLGQIVFTLVLLFFILASGDLFRKRVVEVIPKLRDKKRAMAIADDIERRLGRYLFTITVINAGLGVVVGLAMWALGMPDPLLFGVSAFILNYMPYVGAIIGTAGALIIGLIALPDIWMAALTAAVYFGCTSVEGQLVTPYFVGRSLKLNPVVVFLSVAFWAWLWSVVGMVVAVPMLVVIRVFSEHMPVLSKLGRFLASETDGAHADDRQDAPAAVPPSPDTR